MDSDRVLLEEVLYNETAFNDEDLGKRATESKVTLLWNPDLEAKEMLVPEYCTVSNNSHAKYFLHGLIAILFQLVTMHKKTWCSATPDFIGI